MISRCRVVALSSQNGRKRLGRQARNSVITLSCCRSQFDRNVGRASTYPGGQGLLSRTKHCRLRLSSAAKRGICEATIGKLKDEFVKCGGGAASTDNVSAWVLDRGEFKVMLCEKPYNLTKSEADKTFVAWDLGKSGSPAASSHNREPVPTPRAIAEKRRDPSRRRHHLRGVRA